MSELTELLEDAYYQGWQDQRRFATERLERETNHELMFEEWLTRRLRRHQDDIQS